MSVVESRPDDSSAETMAPTASSTASSERYIDRRSKSTSA